MTNDDAHTLSLTEQRAVPVDSLVFGAAAMVPLPVGAALYAAGLGEEVATVTLLWGAAILCFLAGVRRGVSFRTPGGPRLSQLAGMLALHVLGAGALFVVALSLGTRAVPPAAIGAVLLAAGYGMMIVADPIEAERGALPLHFARLRPVQMLVPTLSFLALAALVLGR